MQDFVQKQVDFITLTSQTLADIFEEPVKVDFIHSDVFSAAVVDCESETLVQMIKKRLFNWQLENTSHWGDRIIHITDKEAACTLMAQNPQQLTSQF